MSAAVPAPEPARGNEGAAAVAVPCSPFGNIVVAVRRVVTHIDELDAARRIRSARSLSGVRVSLENEAVEPVITDPFGSADFSRLAPKDAYTVVVNLGAQAAKFDPGSVLTMTKPVRAGETIPFAFLLETLPSLRVALFSDAAKRKPVLGIKVDAKPAGAAIQAETSAPENAASFGPLPAGDYRIKSAYDATQARRYKPFDVPVTLLNSAEDCSPKVVEIVLVPTCTLTVEVARDDAATLSATVTITLVGPTAKTAVLATAAPTVTWDDLTPGDYTIQVAAQSAEANFRIGRTISRVDAELKTIAEPGRGAKVPVPGGNVTTVKFVLAPPYTKVQFVGYFVHVGSYIGTDNPADATLPAAVAAANDDIGKRASITIDAIREAAAVVDIDPAANVLKIFMSPEFYFRGRQGAYPIETVSGILPLLAAETLKPAYKNWLFVFGSALGYLDLENAPRAQHAVSNLTVGPSMTAHVTCAEASAVSRPDNSWTLRYKPPAPTAEARLAIAGGTRDVKDGEATLHLRVPTAAFSDASTLRLRDGSLTDLFSTTGRVAFVAKTLTVTFTCAAAKPKVGAMLQQGVAIGQIVTVVDRTNHRYECTVYVTRASATFTSAAKLVEPGETEVFNVALVQKGGPTVPSAADGTRQLKEALVYKESISGIDFTAPAYAEFDTELRRLVHLHGDPRRPIPTEGSTRSLSKHKNQPGTGAVTEVNTRGIGGGSILTIDRIDFGLEVCLDHLIKRLNKYYADGHARGGEPKIQVHLIPSCGMSIKNKVAVTDGWVFNVDRSHCAAQKLGVDTNIVPVSVTPLGAPSTSTMSDHFNVTARIEDPRDASQKLTSAYGHIVVYATGDLPGRDTV